MTPLLRGKENLSSYHVSHDLTIYTSVHLFKEDPDSGVTSPPPRDALPRLHFEKCLACARGLEALHKVLRRRPGDLRGGRGTLVGSSLEQSNVDITTAFPQLIMAECGYEANAKAITTADDVMQISINLKQ